MFWSFHSSSLVQPWVFNQALKSLVMLIPPDKVDVEPTRAGEPQRQVIYPRTNKDAGEENEGEGGVK